MNLFYTGDITGDYYQLSEEESKHIIRVLRFRMGDVVFLTNGKGDFFKAEITDENPKACLVRVVETTHEFGKRKYTLHIAIAPTKNIDRFEWFLEKATETGIDEITPIICDHSERKEVKTERLNKVIVAAMKQSVKAYLPKLNPPVAFKNFIGEASASQKFICSTEADHNHLLKNLYKKETDVIILIGPEGDFSPLEIETAVNKNYQIASLGEIRLRTETAGLIACHTILLLNQ